jgi:hypothetical protein
MDMCDSARQVIQGGGCPGPERRSQIKVRLFMGLGSLAQVLRVHTATEHPS